MEPKLYYSYQSDYWLVGKDQPWHYARSLSMEDLFTDEYFSYQWEYNAIKYINLGKLKSSKIMSKHYVEIHKENKTFFANLKDGNDSVISRLRTTKWEKVRDYILRCDKLQALI